MRAGDGVEQRSGDGGCDTPDVAEFGDGAVFAVKDQGWCLDAARLGIGVKGGDAGVEGLLLFARGCLEAPRKIGPW